MMSDYSKSILKREVYSLVSEYERILSTTNGDLTIELKMALTNIKMKIKRINSDIE